MKFLKLLKHYWVIMLTVLVISFWLGFSITSRVNQETTYYTVKFYSTKIETENIDANFFLKALEKYDKDGNLSYSYATVKPNEFFEKNDIEINEDLMSINIKIKAVYFMTEQEGNISEKSLERFEKVMKKVLTFYDKNVLIMDSATSSYISPLLIAIITLVTGFIAFLIFLFIFRNKLVIPNLNVYKNSEIYRYPVTKKYWKDSIFKVKNLKVFDMCMIAILFALQLSLKWIKIPTGFPGLNLGVTYLMFALITVIYGPIWGIIIGFGSDTIGFFVEAKAYFHFGYTLQAMLSGLVYGLCLYKTEVKFSRVLLCRFIINVFINGVLGAFLWGDYMGWKVDASLLYMWAVEIPKNIIYLIPQTILLYIFLRAASVLLIKKGMIPKEVLPTKHESLE